MRVEYVGDDETLRASFIDLLKDGISIRCRAQGTSMSPTIRSGDYVTIRPAEHRDVRIGDIVAMREGSSQLIVHRLMKTSSSGGRDLLVTRGDGNIGNHPGTESPAENLAGRVVSVERAGKVMNLEGWRSRTGGKLIVLAHTYFPLALRARRFILLRV